MPAAGDILVCCGGKKQSGNSSMPLRARQSGQSEVLVLIFQIRTLATRLAGKRKNKSRKDSEGRPCSRLGSWCAAAGKKEGILVCQQLETILVCCGGKKEGILVCHDGQDRAARVKSWY